MCVGFIEFLFPTVPPDEPGELEKLSEHAKKYAALVASCSDESLEVLVGYLKDGNAAEEARRDRVSTRLTSVIAIVGVTVTLASFVARDLVGAGHAREVSWDYVGMLALLTLSLLYFVAAIAQAFLGLRVVPSVQLAAESILEGATDGFIGEARIHRNVARFYASAMIRNRYSTNRKVDRVTAAQQHVLRAAFLLFVGVIVAVVGSLTGNSDAKSACAETMDAGVPTARNLGASEQGRTPPGQAGFAPLSEDAGATEHLPPQDGRDASTADGATKRPTSSTRDAQTNHAGIVQADERRTPVLPVAKPSARRPTPDQ